MKRYLPFGVFAFIIVAAVLVFRSGPAELPTVHAESQAQPIKDVEFTAPQQLPEYAQPVKSPLGLAVRNETATVPYVPPTRTKQPLSVTILGPTKSAISDAPCRFSADVTGTVAGIKWKARRQDVTVPFDSRGLTVTDGGANVSFAGPVGIYTIGVAVSGLDGDVDWFWHDFEITADEASGTAQTPPPANPPPAEQPQQPDHNAGMVPAPPQQPQEDLNSYIAKLVNSSVQSPTRAADAVSVGGCFREIANLIQTGQYTGSDPMVDVRRQSQLALNATAGHWEPFFQGIDQLLASLKQRGVVSSTENVGAVLGHVGTVLSSAK